MESETELVTVPKSDGQSIVLSLQQFLSTLRTFSNAVLRDSCIVRNRLPGNIK